MVFSTSTVPESFPIAFLLLSISVLFGHRSKVYLLVSYCSDSLNSSKHDFEVGTCLLKCSTFLSFLHRCQPFSCLFLFSPKIDLTDSNK